MIKNISSVDAYAILQQRKNAVLIDVRSRMEYEYVGHPANSIHIAIQEPPSWELQLDFQDNVRSELTKKFSDSDKLSEIKIFLICRSGKRSGQAALLLESERYKNIFNVVDGFEGDRDINGHRSTINGWRFHGLPWGQN